MSIARELSDFIRTFVNDKDPSALFDGSFQMTTPEAVLLKEKLTNFQSNPELLLLLILQTVVINKAENYQGIDKVSFVATLPDMKIPGIQSTFSVIEKLLRNASSEVIAFGYEINDRSILKLLHKCSSKGIPVHIACDKDRGTADTIMAGWPLDIPKAEIYIHKPKEDGAPYPKMHSKLVIVDGEKMLLTSANFTFHGMEGNLELGVLLEGKPAKDLRDLLALLLNSKAFLKAGI